jgi:hypothetical protein
MIWRDLATLARKVDAERAAAEARRLGLAWILGAVLSGLPDGVRPAQLCALVSRDRPRRRDALRFRGLLGIGARHHVASVFRLPVANAAAYLVGTFAPSRRFLTLRYGSPTAYLRWWRDAGGRLGRAWRPASHTSPRRCDP